MKGRETELLALVKKHESALRKVCLRDKRAVSRVEGLRHPEATRAIHRALRVEGRESERRRAPDARGHRSVGADGARTDDLPICEVELL